MLRDKLLDFIARISAPLRFPIILSIRSWDTTANTDLNLNRGSYRLSSRFTFNWPDLISAGNGNIQWRSRVVTKNTALA